MLFSRMESSGLRQKEKKRDNKWKLTFFLAIDILQVTLFFTISTIIHSEGELNTVALLSRPCLGICSCVVLLSSCLDWDSKTWWCYSQRKAVHFIERALLKPKTSSGGRSVGHLAPKAEGTAPGAAVIQRERVWVQRQLGE